MARYDAEAKKKEIETRKRLGPRIGHAKKGGHRVTLDVGRPRATGASNQAMSGGNGSAGEGTDG